MQLESRFGDPSLRAHLIWVKAGSAGALLVVLSAMVLLPLFHAPLWPVILTSLVSVFLSSWLLYRRMSAPLVRFMHAFRSVGEGTLPEPLELHTTDPLCGEGEALNAMLEALRAREQALFGAFDRLSECVAHVAEWARAQGSVDAIMLAGALEGETKLLGAGITRRGR